MKKLLLYVCAFLSGGFSAGLFGCYIPPEIRVGMCVGGLICLLIAQADANARRLAGISLVCSGLIALVLFGAYRWW